MRSRRTRGTAFTLVEVVIAIGVVSVGLAAAISVFGNASGGVQAARETLVARELAVDLMNEILTKPFEDPNAAEGSFGRPSGASKRAAFEDVDDYNTWTEAPPVAADGSSLGDGYAGYTRKVTVFNVQDGSPTALAANGSTGTKLILVEVTCKGKKRAEIAAYRTRHGFFNEDN